MHAYIHACIQVAQDGVETLLRIDAASGVCEQLEVTFAPDCSLTLPLTSHFSPLTSHLSPSPSSSPREQVSSCSRHRVVPTYRATPSSQR